jgi:hypothetical protein
MNKLRRVIALLDTQPTAEQASEFATQVSVQHFETATNEFFVAQFLPDDLDEETAARLTQMKEAAGDWACYLLVYPKE